MFKYFVKILVLLLLTCFFLHAPVSATSNTALTKEESLWIKNKQEIIVAFPGFEFPPYVIHSSDGKVLGIYNDYLKLIANQLGLKIVYRVLADTQAMAAAFKNKEVDLIVGFSDTEQRKKFMLFSNPFMEAAFSVLVKKSEKWKEEQSIQSMSALRFATEKGFIKAITLKEYMPDVNIFDVRDSHEATAAIKFGLADAYLGDWVTNNYILDKYPNAQLQLVSVTGLPRDYSKFSVQPEFTLLNSAINKVIKQIDSVTHAYISARWNSSSLTLRDGKMPMLLTKNEQEWLKENPVIKYASHLNWHPFTFQDSEGKEQGLSVELLAIIARKLGIKLVPVTANSWDHAFHLLEKNQVTLLPALSDKIEHKNTVLSIKYHTSPWVLISRADKLLTFEEALDDNRIIVSPRGESTYQLLKKNENITTDLETKNMADSFALLDKKKADVLFALLSTASPWLQNERLGRYKILNTLSAEKNINIHFATSEKNKILTVLINKVLNEMGNNEIKQLNQKWSKLNIQQDGYYRKYATEALLVCIVILLIFIGISFWNRKLQKEVAQRSLAENRARQAEYELNSLADAIPGAVIQFHIDENKLTQFTYVSQGIDGLTPFTHEKLLIQPELLFNAIPIDDKENIISAIDVSQNNLTELDIEFRVIFENNMVNWLHLVAFPEKQNNKTVWNGVVLKINDRKEQEFALSKAMCAAEQAAVTKSRFLAMMSHEIRTPVSGIIGMLELLEHSNLNKMQLQDVKTINNSANNLQHILNDVLDHSKMESKQFSIENIETNLLQLVESALKTHANTAHRKNIAIKLMFDPQLFHHVHSDPVRLQQVLSNLLSNAIKFTDQGDVTLSVTQQAINKNQQTILFSVKDTGIGISPINQRKLFSPFVQAEDSTTRQYGGTGLGLSICKMLIERLGGEVAVSSILGQGSEFSFSLTLESTCEKFLPKISNKYPLILIDDASPTCQRIQRYFQQWQAPLIALPFDNNIERLTSIIPRGQCVFICPEELMSQYNLTSINTLSTWIDLSKRSFSPEPGHHFVSVNPLLITSLISSVNQAQEGKDAELLSIIASDIEQVETTTREQAIEQGKLILVAEDHPTNQIVIKRQLEKLNYHADFVDDGQEALDVIRLQNYGLLLTDCHMPNIDGYELTKTLRAQGNTIPIIALTANALTGEADRCQEMGMDDYLTKPISIPLLKRKLEQFLDTEQDHSLLDISEFDYDDIDFIESDQLDDELSFDHIESPVNNVINLAKLLEMFGGQEDVDEIINVFINSTKESFILLSNYVSAKNFEEVALLAHKIKGAASMISANEIYQLTINLEQSAKATDFIKICDCTEQLSQAFDIFITFTNEAKYSNA